MAAGHEVGVCHGRLIPENVLVDNTGAVRLIGFAVDAAMHGLPPGRVSTDVADLGGLLYCALTGKWPGVSSSALPEAPLRAGPGAAAAAGPRRHPPAPRHALRRGGQPLLRTGRRPAPRGPRRRVRAGHRRLPGAPSSATRRGWSRRRPRPATATTPRSITLPAARPTRLPVTRTGRPSRIRIPSRPEPEPEPDAPARRRSRQADADRAATQAGLPIFDDETDDVSWLDAPAEPAPPPPPFEEPPERPLFAPAPSDRGARAHPAARVAPGHRTTEPSTSHRPLLRRPAAGPGSGRGTPAPGRSPPPTSPADEVPGRSWLRLAAVIAAAVLLLVAVVVAYNLGRGRTPLGAVPDGRPDARRRRPASRRAPRSAGPITGVTATDFDPQGDPPAENPDLAPLAVDGDPATAWRTLAYKQNFGPGGLKTGVGLVLDLGAARDVSAPST